MLDSGKWSKENEKFILKMRDNLIRNALENDYSVIVDDTNLDDKHDAAIQDIAKMLNERDRDIKVSYEDFRDVPIDECIRRNKTRRNRVPSGVILSMYNRYLNPGEPITMEDIKEEPQLEQNDNLPDAVQFDLDGTLALFGDNNPYDRNCLYDKVNYPVFDELRMHQRNGDKILILSGRKGEYLKETDQWLTMNGIKPDLFLMRAIGDTRPDTIVKREMFLNHVAPNYNVRLVYDDRDGIVDVWRDLGLTCLQVAAGNF